MPRAWWCCSVLLTAKLTQLVRDYRRRVMGSRLKLRTVTIFGLLVIPPLLIVYYFALEFLNRGIDSWFDVEVKQGLNEALMLSRAVLDLNRREYLEATETLAQDLELTPERELIRRLDVERRANGALEITLSGAARAHHRHEQRASRRIHSAAPVGGSHAAGPPGTSLCQPGAGARWRLHHSYCGAARGVHAGQ